MQISKTDKMIAGKDGSIGWITFNNPAQHNAVSMEMWEALSDIVNDYANDDAIRVIVVKGAGDKAFVSGADISEFEEKRSSPETYVRKYSTTIAANAPLTVSSIKTIVAEALKDESRRDMALCEQVVDRCFNSADCAQGHKAFMEKRKPKFVGR